MDVAERKFLAGCYAEVRHEFQLTGSRDFSLLFGCEVVGEMCGIVVGFTPFVLFLSLVVAERCACAENDSLVACDELECHHMFGSVCTVSADIAGDFGGRESDTGFWLHDPFHDVGTAALRLDLDECTVSHHGARCGCPGDAVAVEVEKCK